MYFPALATSANASMSAIAASTTTARRKACFGIKGLPFLRFPSTRHQDGAARVGRIEEEAGSRLVVGAERRDCGVRVHLAEPKESVVAGRADAARISRARL